jgi:DNA modification methylase
MKPYLDDGDFQLYHGEALAVLRSLPAESVHCVVTSPPYWGLRDYGTASWEGGDSNCDHRMPATGGNPEQGPNKGNNNAEAMPFREVCGKCGARRVDQALGLEATPELYVSRMVAVFREVRRVLRGDGVCWVNLGDSYVAGQGGRQSSVGEMPAAPLQRTNEPRERDDVDTGAWASRDVTAKVTPARGSTVLKPKDLVGIPWRVAFALQGDGWYLRSDVIWSKPNPMPESVTDRPTKAHEYVFLLTKSARYFFDQEAVRERYGDPGREWWNEPRTAPRNPDRNDGGVVQARPARGPDGRAVTRVVGQDGSEQHRDGERWPNPSGRNVRSVWEIATQPYPEAHFATYPEELVRRCILAGTSERGCCPECGAPWLRQVEYELVASARKPDKQVYPSPQSDSQDHGVDRSVRHVGGLAKQGSTLGWIPSCGCYETHFTSRDVNRPPAGPVVPCTVLDPFGGSGTTALVARKHGRRSILIELSGPYCELAARRLSQLSLLSGGLVG